MFSDPPLRSLGFASHAGLEQEFFQDKVVLLESREVELPLALEADFKLDRQNFIQPRSECRLELFGGG